MGERDTGLKAGDVSGLVFFADLVGSGQIMCQFELAKNIFDKTGLSVLIFFGPGRARLLHYSALSRAQLGGRKERRERDR